MRKGFNMLTQLEKYVITYEDVTGKIICNIPDYYDRYISVLDEKFRKFSLNKDKLAVCPLHDDHDPSFGIIKHKTLPKVMIYHCLGCGRAGTVVRLHQFIERQYNGRSLTDKEACLELCKLFEIPIPDESEVNDDDYEKRLDYRFGKIDSLQKRYTEKEFAQNLLDIRKAGVDLNRVNSECVKMIATMKGLYEWS